MIKKWFQRKYGQKLIKIGEIYFSDRVLVKRYPNVNLDRLRPTLLELVEMRTILRILRESDGEWPPPLWHADEESRRFDELLHGNHPSAAEEMGIWMHTHCREFFYSKLFDKRGGISLRDVRVFFSCSEVSGEIRILHVVPESFFMRIREITELVLGVVVLRLRYDET